MLIRVETQASHAYRPTDRRIAELADQWAFALANLNVRVADTGAPNVGERSAAAMTVNPDKDVE